MNLSMPIRQQNVMVELLDDLRQSVAECDEIDHIAIHVQRPFDLCSYSVVMAVQALADVASKCNEMSSAKDQLLLLQKDAKGRWLIHELSFSPHVGTSSGNCTPSG